MELLSFVTQRNVAEVEGTLYCRGTKAGQAQSPQIPDFNPPPSSTTCLSWLVVESLLWVTLLSLRIPTFLVPESTCSQTLGSPRRSVAESVGRSRLSSEPSNKARGCVNKLAFSRTHSVHFLFPSSFLAPAPKTNISSTAAALLRICNLSVHKFLAPLAKKEKKERNGSSKQAAV